MPKKPIFYDTETTGVKPGKDKIIEIAAYDPVDKRTFSKLINPKMPIPPDATKIHNITDDMVKDAPDFSSIGKEFLEFCSGDVVLIAHNNDAFDQLFLEEECKFHGLILPKWAYLDTLKWARKYRTDLPKHSLQFLREVYDIPANQAHRALDDVIVLAEVFYRMIDDLSIETALELLTQTAAITHMPFGKHQGKPLQEIPKEYLAWLSKEGAFDKKDNSLLKESLVKLGLLQEK